jgi:hypothetical protein
MTGRGAVTRLRCDGGARTKPHQIPSQSHEPRRSWAGARIIGLLVTMVDHGDHDKGQTHLTGAKYHGIHGAYDRSAGHKFAAAK